MKLFQNLTRETVDNAVTQAKEKASQLLKDDAKGKLDVAGDLAKIGILIALTAGAIRAGSGPRAAVKTTETTPGIVIDCVKVFVGKGET